MSLLLFVLSVIFYDVGKSPESCKPLSTALFWTVVVVVAGFFVSFGWLFMNGHNR